MKEQEKLEKAKGVKEMQIQHKYIKFKKNKFFKVSSKEEN